MADNNSNILEWRVNKIGHTSVAQITLRFNKDSLLDLSKFIFDEAKEDREGILVLTLDNFFDVFEIKPKKEEAVDKPKS